MIVISMETSKNPKLKEGDRLKRGIALWGEGMAGASASGVLTALQELGIPLDVLSGSGSAALPAVLYCVKKQEENRRPYLCTASQIIQKNSRFRAFRRGYRRLRQQLDRYKALDVRNLELPCAVVQTLESGKKACIAAPLPAMDCPELSITPDADLAYLIHKGLWRKRTEQMDPWESYSRLTWTLMQMGAEQVLLVRAARNDCVDFPAETKRKNVLEILVSSQEARCAEDWQEAGYQTILSRQMEIYDWAFFQKIRT